MQLVQELVILIGRYYLYQTSFLFLQIQQSDYSSRNNWRSSKSNPWSENDKAGSWLDFQLNRQVKRSVEGEKRIRVLWDEDGQTLEQVYVYYEVFGRRSSCGHREKNCYLEASVCIFLLFVPVIFIFIYVWNRKNSRDKLV